MKKLLILVALACLLLTACADPGPSNPANNNGTPGSTTKPYGTFVPPTGNHGHDHGTVGPAPTTLPNFGPADFTLYLPNESADGFIQKETSTSDLDHNGILLLLMLNGVVNEGVAANACSKNGTQLNLDLNQAFLDQLMTMDASGEKMLVGSIVNTFLNAYDCETVLLTVGGQAFNSGSTTYDSPLGFFE